MTKEAAADNQAQLASLLTADQLAEGKRPDLVIIDSIQTLWSELAESAPGTVTQVRTGVQAMIRFAKQTGAAMVLVGHVTWQGPPAQPNSLQQLPITLTLRLGTTEVNYPAQTTDAGGFFTVSVDSLSGTYNWQEAYQHPDGLNNNGPTFPGLPNYLDQTSFRNLGSYTLRSTVKSRKSPRMPQ